MNDSMDNRIDYIQKVIVITGQNSAGKTTYAAELYKWLYQKIKPKSHLYAFWNKYLFKEAGENDNINCNFCHYINNNKISKSNISADLYVDFMAVMKHEKNSIVIISEGDKKGELEPKLDLLLRDKIHLDYNNKEKVKFERNNIILVCCVRSSVKGSFNDWIEKYTNYNVDDIKEINLQTYSDIAKSIIK